MLITRARTRRWNEKCCRPGCLSSKAARPAGGDRHRPKRGVGERQRVPPAGWPAPDARGTTRGMRASKAGSPYNAGRAQDRTPGACHVADRREARDEVRARAQGRRLQLGGPARPRGRAHRGGADGARHRARLRAGQALPARAARLPRGALRPRRRVRDGRARPARPHHPGGVRRRRPRLRRLRADHARDRARRFRLPLGDVGAVLAGDASDLRLRQRGAAPQVSAPSWPPARSSAASG